MHRNSPESLQEGVVFWRSPQVRAQRWDVSAYLFSPSHFSQVKVHVLGVNPLTVLCCFIQPSLAIQGPRSQAQGVMCSPNLKVPGPWAQVGANREGGRRRASDWSDAQDLWSDPRCTPGSLSCLCFFPWNIVSDTLQSFVYFSVYGLPPSTRE